MTFAIPKSLPEINSLDFAELFPATLNDVDVDRMMTHILEMFIRRGRTVGSKTTPANYDEYLKAASLHAEIQGLDEDRRREVLDGWLRSTVVKMGRAGLERATAKMDYVRPISIAVYRSGLPKSRSRNRKADTLVYQACVREAERAGWGMAQAEIARYAREGFGQGIDTGINASDAPEYDGRSDLDVSVLLMLHFFEGIEPLGAMRRGDDPVPVALPGAIDPIGRDVLDCLALYGQALASLELTEHLAGLLSMRLFQLPLRTALACRQLFEDGSIAADFLEHDAPNPLAMYCDFTRERGSPSDEVARACVQRDLDRMRQFFSDRLFLRSLNQAMPGLSNADALTGLPIAERFAALVAMRNEDEMQMALRLQINRIKNELPADPDGDDGRALIADLAATGLSAGEQLAQILVEGLRKRGLENQVKWFWTTGAIDKPYGILNGTQRARSTWRYGPSDELLTSLLMACFADGNISARRTRAELPIAELLDRLDRHFGILIDRPPELLDSPDARAGAARNREAFVRKLQLLGCFESLSDDFSAQMVGRPREAAA